MSTKPFTMKLHIWFGTKCAYSRWMAPAFPIEEKVRKEYQEATTKHPQKINRTSTLSMLMGISVGLFLKKLVKKAIAAFDSIVCQTREIVRPGRKNERKKHPKKLYYMNYKPL